MKNLLKTAVFVMAAGAASATTFKEDFESTTKFVSKVFGVRIGDGNSETGVYGQWYMGTKGIIDGQAVIQDSEVGNAPRAAVIVLDGSGIPAGTYTLQWDYSLWAGADMDVQVWNVKTGGMSGSYYTLRYADSGVQVNGVQTTGDASALQLGYFEYSNAAGSNIDSGTATLIFTYDGTGDIGLMFGISSHKEFYRPELRIDNVTIIPDPETLGFITMTAEDIRLDHAQ